MNSTRVPGLPAKVGQNTDAPVNLTATLEKGNVVTLRTLATDGTGTFYRGPQPCETGKSSAEPFT